MKHKKQKTKSNN